MILCEKWIRDGAGNMDQRQGKTGKARPNPAPLPHPCILSIPPKLHSPRTNMAIMALSHENIILFWHNFLVYFRRKFSFRRMLSRLSPGGDFWV